MREMLLCALQDLLASLLFSYGEKKKKEGGEGFGKWQYSDSFSGKRNEK